MKRAWFRIHLSTAIVLMFVAGGLIWANIIEREADAEFIFEDGQVVHVPYSKFGWPFPYKEELKGYVDVNRVNNILRETLNHDSMQNLVFNGLIFLLIIICIHLGFEYMLRRKNHIAPPPPTSNK